MDVVLLHNATAGDESHSKKGLLRLLKRHGHNAAYALVDDGLDDGKLIEKAEIVVVAGGDGTVRKTVTRLAGRKRPVAILPLGTANNIARSLGFGDDLDQIVAGWKRAKPRPIDLGIAEGPWGRTFFIEGIGFGLISRTIAILDTLDARVRHDFPAPGDKLHRDVCVLTALAHEMPPVSARLALDRKRVADDFLLLEILNISRAGPGVLLARDADPGDGRFNVVSILAKERAKLVEQFTRHGDGRRGLRLREIAATRIALTVAPCELRIDDKIALCPSDFKKLPRQRARIDVRLVPGAVSILCRSKK